MIKGNTQLLRFYLILDIVKLFGNLTTRLTLYRHPHFNIGYSQFLSCGDSCGFTEMENVCAVTASYCRFAYQIGLGGTVSYYTVLLLCEER